MKLGFFVKESLRALGRNAVPSIAAAATVLITTLVLGVFIPVVQSATGKTNEIKKQIEVEAMLEVDTKKSEALKLRNQILEVPHVNSVAYRSAEQNLKSLDLGKDTKELLRNNPLGPSLLIKPDDPKYASQINATLQPPKKNSKQKPFSPLIDEILDKEDERAKILSATSTIKWLLGILTVVLVVASLLLVANTIRLSIFARRREIEVMRLVGATNWFIRWPFVLEGVLVGALGGVSAVLLLWLAKKTVVDPLSSSFALIAATETISFFWLALALLALAISVSALGSAMTLRRFLRI